MIGSRKSIFVATVLAVGGALVVDLAHARMYQWQSETSGATQLSGEPPSWYRSDRSGPRVRVFDGGNLIDDTAIKVPKNQRETLRNDAFRESEERERAAALKRLERLARQQERRRAEQERLAQAKLENEQEQERQARADASNAEPEKSVSSISPNESLDDATVARLKAIIGEFDRRSGQTR